MGEEIIDINTLAGYLSFVRRRPLMMLREKTIDLLEANISGYKMAKHDQNTWFMDFNDFIIKELDIPYDCAGWRTHILEQCDLNQESAYELFFELFDKYVLYKKINIDLN